MTTWTIERTAYRHPKSGYYRAVTTHTWKLVWEIWRSVSGANGYRYRLKRNNLVIARKK